MRKTIVAALAVTFIGVAAPAGAYYWDYFWSSEDGLQRTLRGLGFLPLALPSTLMSVGSLYYVDSDVRFFKAICHAHEADIRDLISKSRSIRLEETLRRNGQFATGVQVDLGGAFRNDVTKNYVQNVHSLLSDVIVEEIPLGNSRLIFAKLMSRPECNDAAMDYISAGGYVCQGQQTLLATAEFKLDFDRNDKLAIETKFTAEKLNEFVKGEIEAKSNQSLVVQQGRLFAGEALKYGVAMNPTCLAPPHSRFARVLPQSTWGRMKNFVLFRIVEPYWPFWHNQDEHTQTADNRT
jgi:hypothetical protein